MKARYAALVLIAASASAQTRIASDFEIRQMEQQVAKSRDFLSQLSARLNLGDLRATRNESSLARAEYTKAYELTVNERISARRTSEITRYATATSYAALAQAKLGAAAQAFALSEEALRYTSDSAKSWNLHASVMSLLRRPSKAVSASRNAVALATDPLDRVVYRYALASSLIEMHQYAEAERILTDVVFTMQSPAFAALQRKIEEHEAFEIYSTARGDESAYISTLNRAQLRLGLLYEGQGNVAGARAQYENVLAARSDDPTALAGMARLGRTDTDRARYFTEAFDANPFSITLIRDYQRYLAGAPRTGGTRTESAGDRVRLALEQAQRNELTSARATLDALLQQFPDNDTLQTLRREIEARRAGGPIVLRSNPTALDLRTFVAAFADNRITPEQRAQLDQMTFTSTVVFRGAPPATAANQTVFESGTIEDVPFRFSEPTAFQGTFAAETPLRLTYRILGATRVGEADGLLIEPVRLEVLR